MNIKFLAVFKSVFIEVVNHLLSSVSTPGQNSMMGEPGMEEEPCPAGEVARADMQSTYPLAVDGSFATYYFSNQSISCRH